MQTHIIQNGVVVNTILASVQEAEAAFPDSVCVDAAAGGAIGWLYDGQTFNAPPAPPVPVPDSVTMRQARLALLGAGLLSQVDAAIAAMPSPQKEAAQIEWEYAATVERNSPLIGQLAPALGMTEAEMDQLFIEASLL